MSIYEKTICDAGLSPNAPTVGAKIAYVVCTILESLADSPSQTDPSAAKSVLDRVLALGVDPNSTAFRAMQFDLNATIEQQRS